MAHVDIVVSGDPYHVRGLATEALTQKKFRFTWHDDWHALAERGSKTGNLLGGAMAQYFAIELVIQSGEPGQTVVRFVRSNSGWAGGAIGASRVKKNFNLLRDEFAAFCEQQGTLVAVHDVA